MTQNIQNTCSTEKSFFLTVAQGGPMPLTVLGMFSLCDLAQMAKQFLELKKTQHIMPLIFYLKERAILFYGACTFLHHVKHFLLFSDEESKPF